MRDKMIGYSIVCCFVLGVLYLKNKVFNKKLVDEVIEGDDSTVSESTK